MGNNCCCGSSRKKKSDPPRVFQQPQPPIPPKNPKIVVALYSYKARDSQDLSFNKGNRMEVLDDSDHDNAWLFVQHLVTGKKGYVPGNFVATERSVECEDWFFENTSRKEAEELLMGDATQSRGTFLIRPSEHDAKGFSLSLKDWTVEEGYLVKHYRIATADTGEFFITSRRLFDSLAELVGAYSKKNTHGLCYILTNPCRKPEPTMRDLAHTYRDKWEIPRKEIELIERLGKGNFGEVWYGKWRNQIEVAVKTMKKGTTMSTKAFLQEGAIMKKFKHKRLVQLYGICSEDEPVYIITEYMANGSLQDYLRKDQGRTLKFDDLIFIAYQIASGMAHLESLNFIHRDLAARNVLVGENKIIKICDFGLSRMIIKDEIIYTAQGGGQFPLKWTAPEALIHNTFSIKSDVWSYGILLMELFTFGKPPYDGVPAAVVFDWVLTGRNMAQPSDLPDEIYTVMKLCWSLKPEKRPFFHQLENYFEKMNIIYRRSGTSQQIIISHDVPNSYEDHELK